MSLFVEQKRVNKVFVNEKLNRAYEGDHLVYGDDPVDPPYLTFRSPQTFTISAPKQWDGTLEYSTDKGTWTEWDGSAISAALVEGNYDLYICGTGNTVIKGNNNTGWTITGSEVSCIGDIESLLDHKTVTDGGHPMMGEYCFYYMFYQCAALVKAPDLPATTLANYCYGSMFLNCKSLTQAPELPAMELQISCYEGMFRNCKSLTDAPTLPATTLAERCYLSMFSGCTSLTDAPTLPATTLANYCYGSMFALCSSLTETPALPATTLVDNCYRAMFYQCASLTDAPTLPATTLAKSCYENMFYACSSLKRLPQLPAVTLLDRCYYEMFTYCISLKMSPTQSAEYPNAYRIPTSGTGTTATNSLTAMFSGTGGFSIGGTPTINTTYYTSNEIV